MAHRHGEGTAAGHPDEFRDPRRYDRSLARLTFGRIGRARRHVLRLADLRPNQTVLDAGSGTGDLAILAKKTVGDGGRVIGIDASPQMVHAAQGKAAKKGLAVDFRVGHLERLEVSSASVDCVLTTYVLHHVPEPALTDALGEFFRVLKPGGRLLIVEMEQATTWWRLLRPLRAPGVTARDAYGSKMAASGFAQVEAVDLPFRGHTAIRAEKPHPERAPGLRKVGAFGALWAKRA